jgi:WD40 repeat protein
MSPDQSLIASGSLDMTINLWRTGSGARLATLEDHGGGIGALAITPDGSLLVSGSSDRSIRFWRLSDHRYVGSASDPALPVRTVVSFSC